MFTFLSSPAPHPEVSPRLRQAGILLILFLCLFIPFRTPLADNTLSAVKAIPDLLIIALFVWYSVSIRLRYRFTLPDLLFIAFELLALISTVFGLIVLINPFGTLMTLMRVMGAFLVIESVQDMLYAWRYEKIRKNFVIH